MRGQRATGKVQKNNYHQGSWAFFNRKNDVGNFGEVSFFTGRGAPENWGDQVFFLRSKGGSLIFFKE